MGFLMGAYGKLMAGKRLRNLQAQLMRVTSQTNRITKQIGQLEKQQQSQQKMVKANLQAQMQNYLTPAMQGMMGGVLNAGGTTNFNDQSIDSATWLRYSLMQQNAQMQYTQASALWDQMFEMQSESLLQPLKDEEQSLQTEKDNLESQIKIAEAEYQAYKEEEKAGAKEIVPEMTGQG